MRPDTDTVPRRFRLDLNTPAELAIRAAVDAVEALPADVRLTDAVVLLGQARERVADFVDRLAPAAPLPVGEGQTEGEPQQIPIVLPTLGKYRLSSLAELPDWMDRFRGHLERHEKNADLYMQEISGLHAWADMVRAAVASSRVPPVGKGQTPPEELGVQTVVDVYQVANNALTERELRSLVDHLRDRVAALLREQESLKERLKASQRDLHKATETIWQLEEAAKKVAKDA